MKDDQFSMRPVWMSMRPVWMKEELPQFPALNEDLEVDVVIVGAGPAEEPLSKQERSAKAEWPA